MGRWIKTVDRRPPADTMLFVCVKKRSAHEWVGKCLSRTIGYYNDWTGEMQTDGEFYALRDVLCWQVAPKIPKKVLMQFVN